jgi:hypothetical protein
MITCDWDGFTWVWDFTQCTWLIDLEKSGGPPSPHEPQPQPPPYAAIHRTPRHPWTEAAGWETVTYKAVSRHAMDLDIEAKVIHGEWYVWTIGDQTPLGAYLYTLYRKLA